LPDPAKHVILGTAGHIDHGKTELIKALTGVDTDRLREEKERGISIELGFARYRLPSGASVGVVDVPGHERFVRTMLAGTGGIDLVLLVIAADEGVMPQTREHLDIIDLLGIDAGVIALSKADLVSDEEVELARDEARELISGTSLESAEIVPVSAVTGEGLGELAAALDRAVGRVEERSGSGPARLPVDRVFSLTGHGTIVTGTLWSGSVAPGDVLEIYPSGRPVRIRSVQVHDEPVERASAGERTALGLAGVAKEGIERGDTVGAPGALHVTHMFDARLRLVGRARPIENRTRVHVHLGTAEALARVVLLEGDEIEPGSEALAQMRLESPLVAERGDLFVIRSYSPMTTLGGGRVIDPAPERHKRMREDVLEALAVLESGSPEDVLLQRVDTAGIDGVQAADAGAEDAGALEALARDGRLVSVGGRLLSARRYEEVRERALSVLTAFRQFSPIEWGMSAEELRGRLSRTLPRGVLDAALAELEDDGRIARRGDLVRQGGSQVALTAGQEALARSIEARLLETGANPPSLEALRAEIGGAHFDAIVKLMAETGRLVKVTSSLLFHPDVVADIRRRVLERFESSPELGVPEFKDMIGVTRKYAIPLLEYFDREGTTMRSGNARVRGRGSR
jgi:selenocysteine-specific elongation factor